MIDYKKCKVDDVINIERLYDILMQDDIIYEIMNHLDIIKTIIPELNEIIGFDHKQPHYHLDVFNHTLLALSLSEKNFDIRLALLLHDIGKKRSCIEENGIRHFPNHPSVSCEMSRDILNRLGFEKDYIDKICNLVMLHDTPITDNDIINDYDFNYTRFQVQQCDALAHNPNFLEKRKKYIYETQEKFNNIKEKRYGKKM